MKEWGKNANVRLYALAKMLKLNSRKAGGGEMQENKRMLREGKEFVSSDHELQII